MANCPNCGRKTQRTKDWACQWCGYPLLSRDYRPIDKTYIELQEERKLSSQSYYDRGKPEPETENTPTPRVEMPTKFEYKPQPHPERPSRTPPAPVPPPKPQPLPEMVSPEEAPPPPADAAPEFTDETEEPEVKVIKLDAPPPEAPAEAPPSPEPQPAPEPLPTPEPQVLLEDIEEGMEISAGQVDALFRDHTEEANAAFADKTMVIRGIIEKVFVRDLLDIRYLMLTNAQRKMAWGLRCTFSQEESPNLMKLQEGQEVKVRGKFDGYSKNIIFRDCTLV